MDYPDPELREQIACDIVLLASVGIRVIVVHGGGKRISQSLPGNKPVFIKGFRVTDKATLERVTSILNHKINPEICDTVQKKGGRARGIHGNHIFTCEKMHLPAASDIDLGYVGTITQVDKAPLKEALDDRTIPIVSPVARSEDGTLFNTNADAAATAVATAIGARRLVYLCDVPGLLQNLKDPDSLISTVRIDEIERLEHSGIITEGMQPKIQSAVKALKKGIDRVHFIDAYLPHSLLLEIFTDKGIGTELIH